MFSWIKKIAEILKKIDFILNAIIVILEGMPDSAKKTVLLSNYKALINAEYPGTTNV